MFQYPEHQLFEMTVWKDVAFGPTNMKLSESEIKERVEWAMELVGLGRNTMKNRPLIVRVGRNAGWR